jgi:hypothetical protein
MSSRSFRRRNNRRRQRQGGAEGSLPEGAQEGQGQRPDGVPGDGPSPGRPQQGGGQKSGGRQPGDNPPAGSRRNQPPGGGRRQGRGGRESPPSAARANPPSAARGRQGAARMAEAQRPSPPPVPIVLPDCPVCGRQVKELSSALTHRASRQPAHFDCVVRELRESTEVAPQEKICYLGGGSFGVLEFPPQGGPSRFVIRRRIQYEEKDTPQEWKKQLQVIC